LVSDIPAGDGKNDNLFYSLRLLADGVARFVQIPTTIIKHGLPALLTLSSLCKGEAKEEDSEVREEDEAASKNGHILTIVNAKAGEDTNSFLINFPIPSCFLHV
jgi:hypothetical protein